MKKMSIVFCVTVLSLSIMGCAMDESRKHYAKLVILSVDLGSSTDDVFAIQMAHRYMDEGRCKLLGVVCDRPGDSCAVMAKWLNECYGHPKIPVGRCRVQASPKAFVRYCCLSGDSSILADLREERPSLFDMSETPEGWILYRKLLANVPDHSVDIVSCGFMTELSHLLTSAGDTISPMSGVELVERKVKTVYIMGSKLTADSEPEADGSIHKIGDYNLRTPSLTYADTVFRMLPSNVRIIFSPSDVGKKVGRYINESVLTDVHGPYHPICQIYSRFHVDDGQYLWDVLPLIEAVEGDCLFHLSEPGRVSINTNGEKPLVFTPDKNNGNAYYQYIPRNWNEVDSIKFRNAILNRIKSSY